MVTNADDLEAITEESLLKLGYYLKPDELFSSIAKKGNANTENESNFILADLESILNSIEQSTMGTESEDEEGDATAEVSRGLANASIE